MRREQVGRAPLASASAAEGDRRQRVVDFVGDAGGQEADADHPFGADQLPAALVDLLRQVAIDVVQPGGHVVERVGQFLQFVLRIQLDRVREIAAGRRGGRRLAGRGSG